MTPHVPAIHEIWVYLSGSPLLALILTLSAYQLGVMAYERSGRAMAGAGSVGKAASPAAAVAASGSAPAAPDE